MERIPAAVNEGHTSRRSGVTHDALETVPPPAILSASLTWSDCPSACFTFVRLLVLHCPSACFTLSVCLFYIVRLPPPDRLAVSLSLFDSFTCPSVRPVPVTQIYLLVCPTCPCDPGLPDRLSDLSL